MARVEIRPGYFIEVKERRGVQNATTLLFRTDISDSERRNIMETIARKGVKQAVRYTKQELVVAAALARKVGVQKASEVSGIKYWSIKGQLRLDALAGVYKPLSGRGAKGKYTMEQKRQCVRLAKRIASDGRTSMGAAFDKAGRQLGMNGGSVAHMHKMGMIR